MPHGAVAFVSLVLVGCGLLMAGAAWASFSGQNGKLVYETGPADLGLVSPRGNTQIDVAAPGWAPGFTPDGGHLIFSRGERDVDADLYESYANGAEPERLTETSNAAESLGQLTPNGRTVVYEREVDQPNLHKVEIWAMSASGQNQHRLIGSDTDFAASPALSPDGKHIAFTLRSHGDRAGVFRMDLNGSHVSRLASDSDLGGAPRELSYSGDGRRLAYAVAAGNCVRNIGVMSANGGGPTLLTHGTSCDHRFRSPAFSPDGGQIAFTRIGTVVSPHLMVVDADGTEIGTIPGAAGQAPSWGPRPVDRQPPQTSVSAAPDHPIGPPVFYSVTLDSSELHSVLRCRLNTAPWTGCNSPYRLHGTRQGMNTLRVQAIDGAANADPTPASVTFDWDHIRPEATITSGPAAETTAHEADFAFASNEPGTFACRLDDDAVTLCSSPITYTGLGVGFHHLEVRAYDTAGNKSAAAGWDWEITG